MTRAAAAASPAAALPLPAPTLWSLFSCALAALALLWMPLATLHLIDGLLVMKAPLEVLRDLALWWPLALVPAALLALVAWLAAGAARLARVTPVSTAMLAWSTLLLPLLWLCGWQFGRTLWLWLKLQTGFAYAIDPGLRIGAVVALLLLLIALFRRGGAARTVRWLVDAMRASRTAALLVLMVAVAITLSHPPAFSWNGRTARPVDAAAPRPDAPDVFLITIDTVAADDAGVCGDGPTMMPRLRAFTRQRGTCFSRFYAGSNFTTPTISTMETGTLPWRHLAVQPDAAVVESAREATVAHALRNAGYQTYSVTDNLLASPRHRGTYAGYDRNELVPTTLIGNMLREAMTIFPDTSLPTLTMSALGFIGAFDTHRHGERSPYDSQRTYDLAWHRLDQSAIEVPRRPVFLWAHTLPPHSPYLPPPSTRHRLLPAGELERWQDLLPDNIEYQPTLQPLVDKHRLRYRESMMAADRALGAFLDHLEREGRLDGALVVVSADHGESFENGYLGHAGPPLHDALLRVPFIVKLPRQNSPRLIDMPVSQADLTPTILDLAGAAPLPAIEGRSLRALLEGSALEARPVYAMSMERQSRLRPLREGRYAVVDGTHKLVWDLPRDHVELYDLVADPHERVNLAGQQPGRVESLLALLRKRLDEAEALRKQGMGP